MLFLWIYLITEDWRCFDCMYKELYNFYIFLCLFPICQELKGTTWFLVIYHIVFKSNIKHGILNHLIELDLGLLFYCGSSFFPVYE